VHSTCLLFSLIFIFIDDNIAVIVLFWLPLLLWKFCPLKLWLWKFWPLKLLFIPLKFDEVTSLKVLVLPLFLSHTINSTQIWHLVTRQICWSFAWHLHMLNSCWYIFTDRASSIDLHPCKPWIKHLKKIYINFHTS